MKEKGFFRNLSLIMGVVFILIGVFIGEYIKLKNTNNELIEINEELKVSYYRVLEDNSKLLQGMSPLKDYTAEEILLLAKCVEAEAGYYKGHEISQQYVTQVILNRVNSNVFPNTIEEVIYQEVCGVPQFSVAHNGMMYREVKSETLANVYYVLYYGTDLPEYVYYFYSDKVTNNWVNTLTIYDSVQGTVFAYSDFDKEVCSQ